jgi:hypothetical protein
VLLLLVVALVAALAVAVGSPLLRSGEDDHPEVDTETRAALEARKESKYREIHDAELDFRTGKLSEPDFRALDRQLRGEAIAILKEIDELGDERGEG